jgi:lysyl-tRNA synthetase class 2
MRPPGRRVLSWLVAGVGVLAVVNALFPEHGDTLIPAIGPSHAHGVIVPLGAALIVTARSLARGSRRAWQIAIALLALLVALHVERRFDEGALVTGIVLVALVARRADFRLPGDPGAKPRLLVRAVAALAFIGVYGVATIWFNRLMASQPYSVPFALRVTGRALAGMSLRGTDQLSGPVSHWFPLSIFLLGVGSAVLILLEWMAPWRYRLLRGTHELDVVRRLVTTFGVDTLAPFALRSDKSYFFTRDESAFLAYRVVGGVAIVAGDPIGREDAREELVRSFLDYAHVRGWRVAVLGVSEQGLEVYRALGLRALYHGDEAVVETSMFSLEGRAIRKVRQSVHRLEKTGFTARVLRPAEIGAELRRELEEIARTWRGNAPERGFVMALDTLFREDECETVFVVGFDREGRARGFLHFAVAPAGSALSLSSMPRLHDVPNGFNEWLICESIAWAREHRFARVSLNFSPFAALLAPDGELGIGQRLQAATLRRMKPWFQLDNLLLFNRKFFPSWQRRFVVYERRLDLPRVGVAALAAEAYLPFQ